MDANRRRALTKGSARSGGRRIAWVRGVEGWRVDGEVRYCG